MKPVGAQGRACWQWGVGAVFSVAMMLSASCSMDRRQVDEQLLAALGLAQALQYQADELERLGDRSEATARVQKILEISFPADAPEAEDVRLDAYGRLAELKLSQGDDQAAQQHVEKGMSEATRESYFKARLYAVQGKIHQARAKSLREAGNEREANDQSRRALDAFEESIEINRGILGLQGTLEKSRNTQ